MTQQTQSDQLCTNTLRTLSIDAVQQSNSVHSGTPMGAAPAAYCLRQRFLRYDPCDPEWLNRDRFVLSAGHASALLYSLLYLTYLTGVKARSPRYDQADRLAITLDGVKCFRQAGSRCTGHTEYGWISRIETPTGPAPAGREGMLKFRLTLLRRLPIQ